MKYEPDKILKLLNDYVKENKIIYKLNECNLDAKGFTINYLADEVCECGLMIEQSYMVEGLCSYEKVDNARFECIIFIKSENEISIVGNCIDLSLPKWFNVSFSYNEKQYECYGISKYVVEQNAEAFAYLVIGSYLEKLGIRPKGSVKDVVVTDVINQVKINDVPMYISF